MQNIEKTIRNISNYFMTNFNFSSVEEINNGLCVEFSDILEEEIGGDTLSNDFFIEDEDGWNGDGKDKWSIQKIKEYNKGKFDILILNEKVKGYHSWLFFEGKHYDCEVPYGVDNFWELPFFQNYIN